MGWHSQAYNVTRNEYYGNYKSGIVDEEERREMMESNPHWKNTDIIIVPLEESYNIIQCPSHIRLYSLIPRDHMDILETEDDNLIMLDTLNGSFRVIDCRMLSTCPKN